jgi:hypothetical protein
MDTNNNPTPRTEDGEFIRLPGLFRRWELERVIEPGKDFHFEDAGEASDGTPLLAVYWREPGEAPVLCVAPTDPRRAP